jgi:fucose permease
VSQNGERNGRATLVEALRVRRNAKRGLAAGVLLAAVVFVVFVVLPSETTRSVPYYGALWFVLALTVGGLATAVLVAVRAYRLAKEL